MLLYYYSTDTYIPLQAKLQMKMGNLSSTSGIILLKVTDP